MININDFIKMHKMQRQCIDISHLVEIGPAPYNKKTDLEEALTLSQTVTAQELCK